MKRRRNLLLVLLLISALSIGVGYAAITDTLTMNGTTTIAAQTSKLYFSAFTPGSNAAGISFTNATTPLGEGVKNVEFTVTGLSEPGHVATGTYTITNGTDCAMTITNITVGAISGEGATYYKVETDFDPGAPVTLATGATMNVQVTVTQLKGWIGDSPLTTTCQITVNATSDTP